MRAAPCRRSIPSQGSRRLANDCTPKGMPWIMEQPYDIAFERSGDDVVLKLEEFDVARRIRMSLARRTTGAAFHASRAFPRALGTGGRSSSRRRISISPNFKFEIPASEQASIVERFTPTEAGDRLDYEIVVTDPAVFTEPVRLGKYWLSIPGQVLDAYNCGAALSAPGP